MSIELNLDEIDLGFEDTKETKETKKEKPRANIVKALGEAQDKIKTGEEKTKTKEEKKESNSFDTNNVKANILKRLEELDGTMKESTIIPQEKELVVLNRQEYNELIDKKNKLGSELRVEQMNRSKYEKKAFALKERLLVRDYETANAVYLMLTDRQLNKKDVKLNEIFNLIKKIPLKSADEFKGE